MILKSFGWGSGMALVRLVTSFLSIKVTAVALGPGGLALVAQLASFISLCQSMLGQGLVAGAVRLGAEHAADEERRSRVYATVLRLGLVLVGLCALVLAAVSPWLAGLLLHDRGYAPLIALAGLAVAAAVCTDLIQGVLGVHKEIGLIGLSTIISTILGLAVFAPCAWWWGLEGALWASLVVYGVAAVVTVALVSLRSQGLRWAQLKGPFDKGLARQVLGFFPMLVVNGVVPPLVLIVVRETLASQVSLEASGLWQASWRLSEACQALVVASVSLHFMPGMGEHARDPRGLQRHILRSLGGACAVSALLAAALWVGRSPAVHLVFSAGFEPVIDLLPLQLLGDVVKIAAWILAMALVGTMRTGWFITAVAVHAVVFIGLTWTLVPLWGTAGAQWGHVAAGAAQALVAAWALRGLWCNVPVVPRPPVLCDCSPRKAGA